MKATDALKEEHEAITEMLEVLERIIQRIESGGEANLEDLEGILEFIRVFADRCHHGKEEDILFPAMEEHGVPRDGPIDVMLMEHEQGRGYVSNMAEALENYGSGKIGTLDEFMENAKKYIELLRKHIEKENNILYRIAEIHIPEDEDERLLERFEELERERIGPGRHEGFHNLLRGLAATYLE